MGAIESSVAVSASGIQRVVAVEEESFGNSAALIQRVRPGVGSADHEAVAHSLLNADLQRIVIGDSLGFPEVGIGVIADEGHAKSGISVRTGELADGSRHLLGLKDSETAIRVGGLVSIGENLAVDGLGGCGNSGLIEGDGEQLVLSVIADVADVDQQGVARLPLHIESPIL